MSLINRMLHDLDRRGETPRGIELRAVPPASATRTRWLAVLLAAPLAIAAAWLLWPRADVVAPQAPLPVSQPVITQPAAAAVVIEEAVETTAPVENDNEAPAMAEAEPAPAPPAAHAGPAASEPPGRVAVAGQPSAVVIRPHAPSREELRQRARRDGLNAARRGDWVVATRLLQEAIEAAPADDDVREALAVALLRQGRISEADAVLLDGMAVGVTPARFARLRAEALASRGDVATALATLAVNMPAVEQDPGFYALRGALAQQAGDYLVALQSYSALVRFAPGNGTWQAGYAMALDALGDFDEARAAFARALQAGGLEAALQDYAAARLRELDEVNAR